MVDIGCYEAQTAVVNRDPKADAGPDQTVPEDDTGTAQVTLDDSRSRDPDGGPLTYTCREAGDVVAGPTAESSITVQAVVRVDTVDADGNHVDGIVQCDGHLG